MKKSISKILSVVCTLTLVLSLCSFGVAAEETVLGGITAESLAVSNGVNQIPTSIVDDLTLPALDGVTWESSNTDVIANDGTVTRPVAVDEAVTLTATTADEEKTFDFTVKARTTNIVTQDSFASYTEGATLKSAAGWTYYAGTDSSSKIVKDSDGNYCAELNFNDNTAWKRKPLALTNDMIYINFDFKQSTDYKSYAFVRVEGKDSSGAAIYADFYLLYFYQGNCRLFSYENNTAQLGTYTGTEFVPVSARLDLKNRQFYISYNNGAETGPWTMSVQGNGDSHKTILSTEGNTFDTVTFLAFSTGATNEYLYIDNLAVSTATDVDALLPTLTAAEQLAYITDDLTEKFPLADSAALSGETTLALPTYGGIVSWTDADGTAQGDSVTLVQNATTFNSGRLIATITPTGEEDQTSKTYTYPYSVLPANTTVRTKNDHKASFSFDDGWTAPTTMNGSFNTAIDFNVYGTTGNEIPEGVVWAAVKESESELANTVGKFVNTSGSTQMVAIDQCGGTQDNMRMQIGADFRLTQGSALTFAITGSGEVVNIPFDFSNGTFTLKERSNDVMQSNNPDLTTTYNTADYGVEADAWNRIEIDYSTVGFVYDVYLNGIKVNSTPLNLGCVNGNAVYWSNTLRFVSFSIPTDSTLLLDNVTVAETAYKNANALVDGAARRLDRNFATESAFANGETLYNDLKDTGIFPGTAYVYGTTDNSSKIATPAISWTLDGNALTEADGLVPLTFNGLGTHTLEATITSGTATATRTYTVTGAPVALRVTDTNIPEVKLGTDISGRLIVATYTDATMKVLSDVKIYDYENGVTASDIASVGKNVKLFFIDSNLVPKAYSAER